MFLLVPAHPGFPGQIPQSRKTVVCVYSKQTEEKQCFVTNSKELERLSMERGICPIALLALRLTLYSYNNCF